MAVSVSIVSILHFAKRYAHMLLQMSDSEKALAPYTDDVNASKESVRLPYLTNVPKQRSRWFSWKTALLVLLIVAFAVSRLVEGIVKAKSHKHVE